MSAFIAISALFLGSAILLIALLVYWLRQRALKTPKPGAANPRRVRKRKGNVGPELEQEPEPIAPPRQGRSRLISASTLAEAEAAYATRSPTLIELASADEPPPPPSPIDTASRQAIVFRQHFPPHVAADSRSFFGGTPFIPGTLEWPRDPASGAALHFILQVDLAAVPAEARLGLLPETGVLAVFLDLQWGAGDAFQVVWQDGDEHAVWREMDPPTNLTAAYGDEAAYTWPWALNPEHGIQLLPRWPFAPVLISLPVPAPPIDGWDDDEASAPPSWRSTDATARLLLAAQGEDSEPLPERLSLKDFVDMDGESFVAPWPGIPQDWLAIQTCAAALVREADRALRFPRRSLYPDLDDAARMAHLAAVKDEAQAWFDHALGNPALGSIAPPVRKAFWDWFAGHKPLTQLIAPAAAEAAIETTLHASPDAAALLPPEITARLAYRHVLAQRTADGIHAPVPDRMLAPWSDVQGDQQERAATHLLLLELSSNEGLGHRFGEGVYQFWISPGDLAERRFDRVELTRTAY